MPSFKTILFLLLGAVGAVFVVAAVRHVAAVRRRGVPGGVKPTAWDLFVGFFTDFLDTLGIGSFATTTALWRWRRTVADHEIPGTLNVGHALPTVAQAFIYIALVEVELQTLVLMIVAAVLGGWLGAGVVARWPLRKVQLGMGLALLGAAAVIAVRQFQAELLPGGNALALEGVRLGIGLAGNFLLGALMMIGIGLYGPCLVLVSLLGMNSDTGFPIMMGSCAFLMPIASLRFMREERFSLRAALGLTLAGVPAVLLAARMVTKLPLYWVQWLVVGVVVYTGSRLLLAARAPTGR